MKADNAMLLLTVAAMVPLTAAAIFVPIWLVLCFAELEWINPFGNAVGRFVCGAVVLLVAAFGVRFVAEEWE